ncbi:conserved protein of unknown function [Tenacibaculum sp. 190130A14a]|uniref:Uncharacterized protein n=1 Tax=Tenacibaculum polynesiense TaxID=3137857 RepID=A0ABM9PFN0_9FLAO
MKTLDFKICTSIEIILNAEITKGNKIVESSKGWPEKKSTLIILEKPFHEKYEIDNLEYRCLNDPHYWKEEYLDKSNSQTIACRF